MKINIVYHGPSSKTVGFSESELAYYLPLILTDTTVTINNQCSEPDLSISLEVNDDGQTLRNDAFHIHIEKTSGFISGNNERSVLLGAYDYLRSLGCRFLSPGRRGEVLPRADWNDLFMEYSKEASFKHRGVCIEGANSLENILDFVDWLPKTGYNSFFLQFKVPYTFMARWYQHEKNPFCAPQPFTLEDATAYMDLIEAAAKERGLILHKAGHGWTGEVLGLPSLEWKEEHTLLSHAQAEMTAQINGKRQLFGNVPTNTNLCYSHSIAADTFIQLIVDYAWQHQDIDYLHVWLADEYNNVCECSQCKKTTLSDQYVDLLNRIDQALTQKLLKTKLVFLLYQELLWPPAQEVLQNPDRFVLMFAPISRTFEGSYDLKQPIKPIPAYHRNQITLPVDLTENLAFLREWQKSFSGDSFIYDYPLGRAHYGDLGYVHIARVIGEDIKKLRHLGLNGYLSCQELRSSLPNALPNYIMGHTLFDINADTAKLTDEYFQAAYGADSSIVLSYLDSISRLSSCDYFNGIGPRFNPQIAKKMTQIVQIAEDFSSVLEGHRLPDGQWGNLFWKLLDYHRGYVLRLGKALAALSEGKAEDAKKYWLHFRQLICENEPEFQEFLDVYRILEVSVKYTQFPQ